jgi:hypothetical protein
MLPIATHKPKPLSHLLRVGPPLLGAVVRFETRPDFRSPATKMETLIGHMGEKPNSSAAYTTKITVNNQSVWVSEIDAKKFNEHCIQHGLGSNVQASFLLPQVELSVLPPPSHLRPRRFEASSRANAVNHVPVRIPSGTTVYMSRENAWAYRKYCLAPDEFETVKIVGASRTKSL